MTALLVVLAIGFAWSMGAHYTGACMGMPYALRALTVRRALVIMAPLTLLGATFASHRVENTVGHRLLVGSGLAVTGQVIVLAVAFGLTTLFTQRRIPTSTIQILVFSSCGVALAAHVGVHWATIATLAGIWVIAPIAAAAAGFTLTRLLDRIPAMRPAGTRPAVSGPGRTADGTRQVDARRPTGSVASTDTVSADTATGRLAIGLIAVGAIASFAMGANDVSNATGALVGTGTLTPLTAGLIGGAGLALGVLTWGRPLLHKLAFDVVTVDRVMATAAQLVQGLVVLIAVAFGYFTSMNQALVGAMAGAGAARGRQAIHRDSVIGILRGWIVGPAVGLVLGYAVARGVLAAGTGSPLGAQVSGVAR